MIQSQLHNAATSISFLLMAFVAAGCGGAGDEQAEATAAPTTAAAPTGPVDGPPMSSLSSRGTFQIEVTPKGGPVPTNEPFDVKVSVTNPETGAPFTAFDAITLDARMPGHDHGMTRDVELVPTDTRGEYVAEGLLFHMIGYWEFHVDVVQGPRMERAQVATTLEF
jgi:hypothetical protein